MKHMRRCVVFKAERKGGVSVKRICLLMLLLAGLCACARAQVLTYGGSGDDVIE